MLLTVRYLFTCCVQKLVKQKAKRQLYYVKRQWPNTRYLDTFNIFTDRDYNHRIEPFLGPMGQGIKVTIGCFDKF